MRLLALETNVEKIKDRFLCEGEDVLIMTRYHALSFFFSSLREMITTIVLFGIGIAAWYFNAPMGITVLILFVVWLFVVFFSFMKALIDWRFDFIMVTTDRVILMDQTSIIRRKVNPINIENIGSVSAETQYWGVFPFGIVQINLKEGQGGKSIVLRYVPNAPIVASKIGEVVTTYQRSIQTAQSMQQPQGPVVSSV